MHQSNFVSTLKLHLPINNKMWVLASDQKMMDNLRIEAFLKEKFNGDEGESVKLFI